MKIIKIKMNFRRAKKSVKLEDVSDTLDFSHGRRNTDIL